MTDSSTHEVWFDAGHSLVHTVQWQPPVESPTAPPVLLVHGLGGSTVNWDLVGQGLANRFGSRVTAIDLPGFGRTRAEHRRTGFDDHRDVVTAFLTERGPALVAGNSMGGAVSVAVAAEHPELVTGVVLVNAAYPRPSGNLDQVARTIKFATLTFPRAATPIVHARARRLGPDRLVDATLLAVLAEPERLDPGVRDRLIDLAAERRHYPEAAAAYTESGGSLFRYLLTGMRPDLLRLDRPTMILHGRRDRLVPVSFARAVARRRADWQYVELAECGHAPQLETPDRFVEIVSGWADHRLRDPATHA
ncbi:MAG: alpha/beta hydrolase [Acidimicrobiia bacterium]|nr:alpha/beta hydrolase [Acidimicrobiia bacterium]